MPAATTSMRTSPSPGAGSSTSDHVSTSGPPGASIVTADTSASSFLEPLARYLLKHLDVPLAGRLDDVRRDLGAGRSHVPAGAGRPVADHLFVEGVLRATGTGWDMTP